MMIIIGTNILTCSQVSLFLILLIIPILGAYSTLQVKCLERERIALLKFKAELIDDYGRLSSWGNETGGEKDCCKWIGVSCDTRNKRIVALDLRTPYDESLYQLTPLGGKISPSLLELAHLNYLDLSFNEFSNQRLIPEFIGSLGKLQYLNLSCSDFAGPVPRHLGNLSMLRHLDLSGNLGLETTNLDWLSGLRSLEYINLKDIYLEKATTWLQAMSKLTTLKELHLRDCWLSNDVSSSLHLINNASFNSLLVLDLSLNYLSFTLTLRRFLNMSSSLSYLDLSNNPGQMKILGESGSLRELGSLTDLSYLDLSGNNLEGNIHSALWSLVSISYLDLSYNNLHGEFSQPFMNNGSSLLRYLDLSGGNKLDGQLSHLMMWFWKSTKLEYLDLDGNVFRGSLPNMSRFPMLKELRLWGNKLNESLKEGNLRLPSLVVLDLSGNNLVGAIPDISSCLSLRSLSLSNNMFNGTLPQTIGYLSNVVELDLGSNHLEGLISEAQLFNLSKLRDLTLSYNSNLNINISSTWNPPFRLSGLMLANCQVGPRFPGWLRKQENIEFLDISNSKISDSIPSWFWNDNRMLSDLNMSYNQIYGVLPDLQSQYYLYSVDLSSNELNGSLPLLSPQIAQLKFSSNKFSGTLINVCNHKNLNHVDLSNNLFSYEIPQDCFKNLMSNIVDLILANNNFFGELPNSTNLGCLVQSLSLRNNNFTGEISSSILKNCGSLTFLDLGENKFTGEIPGWLGDGMPRLRILILKSNELRGNLPRSLCHLSYLNVLDISINNILGTIPKCVTNFTLLRSKDKEMDVTFNGNLSDFNANAHIMWKRTNVDFINAQKWLKAIDLSSNNITGEIPREVTSLVGLVALNLSGNNLVGSIPGEIGLLDSLNFLDLSKNRLSGHIPPTLSQLNSLGILDLSFNNLSGKIPWVSHMQTFDNSSYASNPGLCGPPLVMKPCPEDEIMSKNSSDGTNSLEHDDTFITRGFYISMSLGFIIAFWGVSGTLFLSKWWNVTIVKMFAAVEDWLYVKVLVNKKRLKRYFQSKQGAE